MASKSSPLRHICDGYFLNWKCFFLNFENPASGGVLWVVDLKIVKEVQLPKNKQTNKETENLFHIEHIKMFSMSPKLCLCKNKRKKCQWSRKERLERIRGTGENCAWLILSLGWVFSKQVKPLQQFHFLIPDFLSCRPPTPH